MIRHREVFVQEVACLIMAQLCLTESKHGFARGPALVGAAPAGTSQEVMSSPAPDSSRLRGPHDRRAKKKKKKNIKACPAGGFQLPGNQTRPIKCHRAEQVHLFLFVFLTLVFSPLRTSGRRLMTVGDLTHSSADADSPPPPPTPSSSSSASSSSRQ